MRKYDMTRELDEILSGAIQDEPPATEPKVQTETPDEPQGQPRDETGKFASKDATDPEPSSDQPTADETDEQPKTSGTVPQKALHEARKKEQAEREGLHEIFKAAGFDWREPGCSMCIAMNGDLVQPGQLAVSTSNRNFEGRQGAGGRTHLVSPAMAAAAAMKGRFVDVRKLS